MLLIIALVATLLISFLSWRNSQSWTVNGITYVDTLTFRRHKLRDTLRIVAPIVSIALLILVIVQ